MIDATVGANLDMLPDTPPLMPPDAPPPLPDTPAGAKHDDPVSDTASHSLEARLGGRAGDDDAGRSRLLLATAERDRLEQVLRMLPSALVGGTPRCVARVLAEGACLLTNARVAWVVLPETEPVSLRGGPDAGSVDTGVEPARWPIVTTALGGTPVHAVDLSVSGSFGGWGSAPGTGTPRVVTADGRPLRAVSVFPLRGVSRLRGDQEVRGALVLAHHRAGAFSERQLSLAGAFADHLGQALDVCEAVREQTRVAHALQETLLPPVLPEIDGVEIDARYRPSGSGNLVGGDFYDVFADGAGGWWLLLGDASGIGPEAAGLAGVARYTARALAESGSGATEMLAHLNRALLRAAPEDRFCTTVLAHLRPTEGGALGVSLAVGGHPPPFLQHVEGAVEPALSSTGLVLGIMPDASVGEAEFLLGPGDALVCYTDGVVEAHAESGEQFGDQRLVHVLEEARGRSAAGTARRIERAVVDFRSPDDRDDLAIVVVRCKPSA